MKGFHQVDARTTLIMENGIPVEVRSTARDLDRAFEATERFYGRPLTRGAWELVGYSGIRGKIWGARVELNLELVP